MCVFDVSRWTWAIDSARWWSRTCGVASATSQESRPVSLWTPRWPPNSMFHNKKSQRFNFWRSIMSWVALVRLVSQVWNVRFISWANVVRLYFKAINSWRNVSLYWAKLINRSYDSYGKVFASNQNHKTLWLSNENVLDIWWIWSKSVFACVVCRGSGFLRQAGSSLMLWTWWRSTVCCPRTMWQGAFLKFECCRIMSCVSGEKPQTLQVCHALIKLKEKHWQEHYEHQ